MKEQILKVILPELPIVGTLELSSRDGKRLSSIRIVKRQKSSKLEGIFAESYLELKAYLTGEQQTLDLKVDLSLLSPFHQRVLKEMKKVSYGKVARYKDLAQGMKSKGYQAIGSACGKNPFMLVYPCHRIVGSKDLGGFAHGLKMKKELLKLEGFLS